MVWCFFDSRRIKRRPSQCLRESCSLGCLLKSLPGTAPVSKVLSQRYPTKTVWLVRLINITLTILFQKLRVKMNLDPWMGGSMSSIQKPHGRCS